MVETLNAPTALASRARFAWSAKLMFGGLIIAALVVIAVFAPWIAPRDPLEQDLMLGTLPPNGFADSVPGYYLGTDDLGRDILSRMIFGTRIALVVAVAAAVIATMVGTALGLLAGYYGGWWIRSSRVWWMYGWPFPRCCCRSSSSP